MGPAPPEVRDGHTGGPAAGVTLSTVHNLISRWRREGCAGRAWTEDSRVGIAAPYATDSLVISGDHRVVAALVASPLEAFEVNRFDPFSAMTP